MYEDMCFKCLKAIDIDVPEPEVEQIEQEVFEYDEEQGVSSLYQQGERQD
jgi:hypothetical protein